MSSEQSALLVKARRSPESAKVLAARGDHDFAASRVYYTMFYMAEAILLGKGLSFSSHSAVHAAFGTHFAKTGLVTPELHRFLLDAFDIRGKSDYEIAGTVSESEAAEQIAHAEQFVDAVQHFLEG